MIASLARLMAWTLVCCVFLTVFIAAALASAP